MPRFVEPAPEYCLIDHNIEVNSTGPVYAVTAGSALRSLLRPGPAARASDILPGRPAPSRIVPSPNRQGRGHGFHSPSRPLFRNGSTAPVQSLPGFCDDRGPANLTMKWPGVPTPKSFNPIFRAILMYRTESVIGIPARRSITSLRKLLRASK